MRPLCLSLFVVYIYGEEWEARSQCLKRDDGFYLKIDESIWRTYQPLITTVMIGVLELDGK